MTKDQAIEILGRVQKLAVQRAKCERAERVGPETAWKLGIYEALVMMEEAIMDAGGVEAEDWPLTIHRAVYLAAYDK